MNSKYRRKIEMGGIAHGFSVAHPHPSPAYAATVTRLGGLLGKSEQLVERRQAAELRGRAATARKRNIRRRLKRGPLAMLVRVATVASDELPDLAQKVVFKPSARTDFAFLTAGRGIVAEAQTHLELLVKHGLVDSVLETITAALDEFEAAVKQSAEGRQVHVGATAELGAVADDIVKNVRILDALNRHRFENDAESLAAWESASNVVAARRPASKPDDIQPAA